MATTDHPAAVLRSLDAPTVQHGSNADRRAERLLIEQERLLARMAEGAVLADVLIALTEAIGRLHRGARAAVLMTDADHSRMGRTYAYDLPAAVGEGIRGIPVNDLLIGTCSTAIFRGEPVTCANIAAEACWSKPWRDLCVANGVRAAHSTPVFGPDGTAIASCVLLFGEPHEPDAWERGLGQFGSHIAGIAIERERTLKALAAREAQLESEIAGARLLQGLSARLVRDEGAQHLYKQIVEGAKALLKSQCASMQTFHPGHGRDGALKLTASCGFNPEAEHAWQWIDRDSATSCGEVLRSGARVIIADVENCGFMAGTETQALYLRTGIRSMQSTPLVSRGGELLGLLSTHWKDPHQPAAGELRLLDLLTRQAADLIEHRRGELTANRLASIVEASDDAIVRKDLDGIIETWNGGAERMFGYTADEAIGKSVTILMPPDRVDEEPDILARIRRGERVDHYETVRQRKDGSLLDVSLTVSPIMDRDGTVVAASKIARDITGRKGAEAVLRASEAQLRRASRAKDEFIAMLGHELRNPLAPITTTLELMKLRAPETFARERGVIEGQVRYLTGLVDDLLDVARIARGKVELKVARVAVGDIVAAAVESTQSAMEDRRQTLHVHVDGGVAVSGDRRRLVQIVVNLLTNAAKYSPPGRNIYLSACAEDGRAVLRVRDEGQGIAPELLPHVFELFTQDSQAIDRAGGGLGLGLAIVRNLVELHHGSVCAASDGAYKGSEFTVRLPLLERVSEADAGSPEEEPAVAAPAARPGQRTRVLVVDDYAMAADSLAMLLQEMGYHTRIARDGAEALQAIKDFLPQVALVDIGLPVIDGYEVAQTVRRTPGQEHLPLVAITGYGQASDRARVMQAGFNEHLVKPLDVAKVGELIEQLVQAP